MEKTCHVWKQRATFFEEVPEASHWKKRATLGSQRATLVRWRRKIEKYFSVQICSKF